MNIYLIDYENVHDSGLDGVRNLGAQDKVVIFYGEKIKTISFERHMDMMASKATVEYYETGKIAKNYLDFQLATYLGYIVGTGQNGAYYIISNDTGFDSVVDFWRKKNRQITRQTTISGDKGKKAAEAVKTEGTQESAPNNKRKNGWGKSKAVKSEQEAVKSGPVITTVPQPESMKAGKVNIEKTVTESVQPVREEGEVSEQPEATVPDKKEGNGAEIIQEETEKTGSEKSTSAGKTTGTIVPLPESYRKKIRQAVKNDSLSVSSYTKIYRAIVVCRDKLELNNSLVKAFTSEKGGKIYNQIKGIFEEFQAEK